MGVLYILVSGAAFGLLPLFVRSALDHGAEPLGLLTARFVIAAAVLVAIRILVERGRPWPERNLTVQLFLLGALGYAVQSSFYFWGIDRIDVSLATVIFYTYPVMVVLAGWIVFGNRPTAGTVACLAIVVGGAALTAGQIRSGSVLGVLAMLATGAWYTGYILVSSRITHRAGALTSLTIVMIGASVAHLSALPFHGSALPGDATAWWSAAGAALVSTVVAMGFFFAGVARLDAGVAAVLSTTEPVVSILVGVLVLDERLSPTRVVGAAAVLIGVALMAQLSRTDRKYISTAESISE